MKVPYPPTTMLIVAAIYLSVILLAAYLASHMHSACCTTITLERARVWRLCASRRERR